MESFWKSLPRPFFVLAPMADVTDPAYRKMLAQFGKPDVTWTEFVSADGLYHTREKKGMTDEENPLMRDLRFTPGEHPIVAQLFTKNPETVAYAANLCKELGFDGVDINMGCPVGTIVDQGAGAAMIKDIDAAKRVIEAARTSGLPVTVKTRIGYNEEELDTWIAGLLGEQLPVLTVHLRTRKEMSKVPAHWEIVPRLLELRDEHAPETLIVGNGDVQNLQDAKAKAEVWGVDGVMLGRAIFGNPWVFAGTSDEVTPRQRIEALLQLARGFDELRPRKSFHILKKHFKAFIGGWDGASQLRAALMEKESLAELEPLLVEAAQLL